MPTASSAQMRKRIDRRDAQIAIRYLILSVFLITCSHIKPVPISRVPATIKSSRVQFISSVNCITINGMSNRIADISTIMIILLFFLIISVTIVWRVRREYGTMFQFGLLPNQYIFSSISNCIEYRFLEWNTISNL